MNFWHIVRVVTARKWIVIGLVAVTLVVIVIAAPRPRVTYEATCFVAPTPQAMRGGVATVASNSQNTEAAPDRNVVLSNLVLLAQTGEVLQRASDFLALPEDKQEALEPGLPAYKRIPRLMYSPDRPLGPTDWPDVLQVAPVVNAGIGENGTISDVIRLTVKLPIGEDVPYIVNAVGVAFMEAYRHKSHEDSRKYTEFLKAGKDEAKQKLGGIESRIGAYKRQHKVVAADSETQNAVDSLAHIEAARDSAQAEADEADAALADINHQLAAQPLVMTETLPADMNPKVVKLKGELAQAEADLRLLATRYKPEHTSYRALEAQVKLLKERIAREGESFTQPSINEVHNKLITERSSVANRLASATAKLRALNGQVGRAQTKVVNLAGAQTEMVDLTREQQQASDEYTLFAQKLAQSRIADKEFEKTGSIIPYGWSSPTPAGPRVEGPRLRVLLLYGFALSLVLGVALSVWLDSIDNRVRNARDVEELLGLPAVGLIPALKGQDRQLPRLTHLYPLSAAAESYRILRTNVLFAQRDSPFKTLMVATGKPGQGATSTICNLAIALAQIGKKIILVDGDMRRPTLHRFFELSNDAGLSTLLQGKGNPMESICQTEVENLIVIPAGPVPLNPSELLASERMYEIVNTLKEHCDMMLFDTPSTIVFSDGPVLASWLDAVLFVVSANQVPTGTEHQALDSLRKAKANIIGTVVNRMSPDSVDSCFYYSRYYAGAPTGIRAITDGRMGSDSRRETGEAPAKRAKGLKVKGKKAVPAVSGSADPNGDEPAKDGGSDNDNPFPD